MNLPFNAATSLTVDQTKKSLDLPIGLIAASLGCISDVDREKALVHQADLVALATANVSVDDKIQFKADEITKLKAASGITPDMETAARAIVDSKQGVPKSVPPLGVIFTALGFVGRDTKNALLTAQAAARTLTSVDNIQAGTIPPGNAADIATLASSPMFANIGKFSDPVSLTQAQATQFAAAMMEKRIAAGLEPKPQADGFKIAALASLRTAGHDLQAAQPAASAAIIALADSYNQKPAAPAATTAPKGP